MTTKLETTLKNRARAWAGQMTRLARAFAPAHVRDAISSHVEERGEGTFIIRTIADRKKAPDARAQEYGSGIHSRRGPKQEYPILPKSRKMLAFYENAGETWDYEAVSPPMPRLHAPDGRGLFYGVMHPGIPPANGGKGYIRPAQIEVRKRIKEQLNKDIPDAIRAELRLGFGKK